MIFSRYRFIFCLCILLPLGAQFGSQIHYRFWEGRQLLFTLFHLNNDLYEAACRELGRREFILDDDDVDLALAGFSEQLPLPSTSSRDYSQGRYVYYEQKCIHNVFQNSKPALVLPKLKVLTHHPKLAKRILAAEVLTLYKATSIPPPLEELARAPAASTRNAYIKLIGESGLPAPKKLTKLTPLLLDPVLENRLMAAAYIYEQKGASGFDQSPSFQGVIKQARRTIEHSIENSSSRIRRKAFSRILDKTGASFLPRPPGGKYAPLPDSDTAKLYVQMGSSGRAALTRQLNANRKWVNNSSFARAVLSELTEPYDDDRWFTKPRKFRAEEAALAARFLESTENRVRAKAARTLLGTGHVQLAEQTVAEIILRGNRYNDDFAKTMHWRSVQLKKDSPIIQAAAKSFAKKKNYDPDFDLLGILIKYNFQPEYLDLLKSYIEPADNQTKVPFLAVAPLITKGLPHTSQLIPYVIDQAENLPDGESRSSRRDFRYEAQAELRHMGRAAVPHLLKAFDSRDDYLAQNPVLLVMLYTYGPQAHEAAHWLKKTGAEKLTIILDTNSKNLVNQSYTFEREVFLAAQGSKAAQYFSQRINKGHLDSALSTTAQLLHPGLAGPVVEALRSRLSESGAAGFSQSLSNHSAYRTLCKLQACTPASDVQQYKWLNAKRLSRFAALYSPPTNYENQITQALIARPQNPESWRLAVNRSLTTAKHLSALLDHWHKLGPSTVHGQAYLQSMIDGGDRYLVRAVAQSVPTSSEAQRRAIRRFLLRWRNLSIKSGRLFTNHEALTAWPYVSRDPKFFEPWIEGLPKAQSYHRQKIGPWIFHAIKQVQAHGPWPLAVDTALDKSMDRKSRRSLDDVLGYVHAEHLNSRASQLVKLFNYRTYGLRRLMEHTGNVDTAFTTLLDDPSPVVQKLAHTTLVRRGPRTVRAIARAYPKAQYPERLMAVLVDIGAPGAAEIEKLFDQPRYRPLAIRALPRVVKTVSLTFRQKLLAMLKEGRPPEKLDAAYGLGHLPPLASDEEEALLAALESDRVSLRFEAAVALAQTTRPAQAQLELAEQAVGAGGAKTQRIIEALGRYTALRPETVHKLAVAYDRAAESGRWQLLDGVIVIGPKFPAQYRALWTARCRRLIAHSDPQIAYRGAACLIRMGDEHSALKVFVRQLKSEDKAQQKEARSYLRKALGLPPTRR